ncbi:uncharacterized protein [Macrobrachium rosenbergii]|uniref:uncharacterized protein n=1 Tax=Macrobrachium rosenbergii TaxID=79674 RepID=UPI0034D54B53
MVGGKEEMANERVDDCQLCCEIYMKTRRPRILPCGHSYCTECLEKLLQNEGCSCPVCNSSIKASSASDFSINYALESAISDLSDLERLEIFQSLPKDRYRRFVELIGHHKTCSRKLLDYARELSDDLLFFFDFLSVNIEKHDEMAEKLEKRCELHNEIIKDIKKERTKVAEANEKVTDSIEKLEATLPQLDKVVDSTESADAVSKAIIIFGELTDLVDKCKGDYPDPTIANAQMLLDASGHLQAEEEGYDEDLYSTTLFPSCCTVSEKICISKSEGYFKAGDLRMEPEEWRKKMKTGKVVAEIWSMETVIHANISVANDQVYLHCLRDGKPPQLSFLIEHSQIMSCLKTPKVVFLDIAWNGIPKGRVHIKLTEGSALAEHFLSLCVGNLGPTYLNKNFDNVVYASTQTERIGSQPYGGSFLDKKVTLEDAEFYGDINSHNACEGIVWMERDYSFYVLTGSGRDCIYNRVFGQVTQGLEVLAESVKRLVFGEGTVTIADTGVVLDL